MPCVPTDRRNLMRITITHVAALTVVTAMLFSAVPARSADWQPMEKVVPYSINGNTGPKLYQSIGDKGPVIGTGKTVHVIAHTTFTLTWTRNYVPQQDGACVLATAIPKLTVIYTLPRPSAPLQSPVRENWARFIAGIETHERGHGRHIIDMVTEIEAASVGLRVADDTGCKKIRIALTKTLGEISDHKRERDRVFEQSEMAPGGPIQQLILALVNGG